MIWPNSGASGAQPTGDPDEFATIERLRARFEEAAAAGPPGDGMGAGEVWIGDDAAVVHAPAGSPELLATDLVVAGVHVDLGLCRLDDVGYKAVMVTVSDLAAMGARPRHLLLSVAAPAGTDLDLIGEGVAAAAAQAGCAVVGGDLAGSPALVVSVAAVGWLARSPERGPLLRSGARPGDHLMVTGPLGASAAGLRLLRRQRVAGATDGDPTEVAALVRAHRRPAARLDEGEAARLAGAGAAIDVSDGLAADIRHLAEASGVGLELDEVPAAPGATDEEAVGGGEEYELIVAAPDPGRVAEMFAGAGLRPPIVIGRCTDRPGTYALAGGPLPVAGWRHRFG